MQIQDRVFLITGAASGLGAACAERFAAAGGKVVAFDRSPPPAGAAKEGVIYAAGDVTTPSDVAAAVRAARETFGGLHGAINCAGILRAARLVGKDGPHDLALFEEVIRVNLVGTFNVMRLAAAAISESPPDEEGERGVIINTASIAAWEGQIGQSAYAASKGGVAGLTLPAARELARFGIRVAAIAPGVFGTSMMSATPDQVRDSLAEQTPFPPRFGRPDEFAALAQHIAQNPMLNGCVLRLDGAMRMGAK